MPRTRLTLDRTTTWLLCLLTGVLGGLTAGGDAGGVPVSTSPCALPGFATPALKVTLAAVQTGRIAEVMVREGDRIAAGEVAVRLDDAVQRQRVALAQARAESLVEVDIAQLHHDQAARELKRMETLGSRSAASTKELTDARTVEANAALELALARFRQSQAEREYALQQALLNEHSVRAPFAGYVSERLKEVGDTVEEREAILTLVQLDPLVVTCDCPIAWAARLREGQEVPVQPSDAPAPPRVGAVVFVNRVADAASQTVKVRLHVPNPDGDWVAGMQVRIDLTAARRADTQPAPGAVPRSTARLSSADTVGHAITGPGRADPQERR